MDAEPARVLMICLGNICRSPMAEAVGTALVAEAGLASVVVVESFGTAGYHQGEGADPRAIACLRRHGWPPGHHRARRLELPALHAAELVLCADRANVADVRRLAGGGDDGRIRLLRSFDPLAGPGDDEVPDPWADGDAEFDHALELIERSCRGLVTELAASRR